MYWIGVFVLFILCLIWLGIIAYKDKCLSITTTVVIGIIFPFTSWAGIIVGSIIIVVILFYFLAFKGTEIMIWKSKDY